MKLERPALRYHGGKWRIAPWIIGHFPPHRVYVEPFGGAGSVLMRKPRSFAEVYNDLDEQVVNVFRVLRDPKLSAELERVMRLTPWSRKEFYLSYEPTDDLVEQARRSVARSFMSYGSTSRVLGRTGFRAAGWKENNPAPYDFASWPDQIAAFCRRLRGVVIECRPAVDLVLAQDAADTLFYLDPPYPIEARTSIRCPADLLRTYAFNMTDDDHRALALALRAAKGMVIISGYRCELYDEELFPDWSSFEREAMATQARKRTEVLWVNPAGAAAIERARSQLKLSL